MYSTRPAKRMFYKMAPIFIIFLLFVICMMLSGCHSSEPLVVEKVRTEYVNRTDSFYDRDSIYIHEYTKGDTVYVDKVRDRYIKNTVHDTIMKVDSIPYPVTKIVEKRYVPAYYKKVNRIFWTMMAILLCLGVYKIRKMFWVGRR